MADPLQNADLDDALRHTRFVPKSQFKEALRERLRILDAEVNHSSFSSNGKGHRSDGTRLELIPDHKQRISGIWRNRQFPILALGFVSTLAMVLLSIGIVLRTLNHAAGASTDNSDALVLDATQQTLLLQTPSLTTEGGSAVAVSSTPEAIQQDAGVIYDMSISPAAEEIAAGSSVTATWQASGVSARSCIEWNLSYPPQCYDNLPLSGSKTFPFHYDQGIISVHLFVKGIDGTEVKQTISVDLGCKYAWTFAVPQDLAVLCPTAAQTLTAAAEPFEKGWMIWTGDRTAISANSQYLILFDSLFTGTAVSGDHELEIIGDPIEVIRDTSAEFTPPLNFYAPASGFGYVWRGDIKGYPDGYKDTLGWALQPEFGYSPFYQCVAAHAHGNSHCLIEYPEGGIVELINSGITFWYWRFLSAGTQSPPLTPTTESDGATIYDISISPSAEEIATGSSITATWQANGVSARICIEWNQSYPPSCYDSLPLSGSKTFPLQYDEGKINIHLFVMGADDTEVKKTVSIDLGCKYEWVFDGLPQWQVDLCPAPPIPLTAAAEPFERGWMIWTGDTDKLYFGQYLILFNSLVTGNDVGTNRQLETIWDPIEVIRDTSAEFTPPLNFYAPTSGFGYIWRGDIEGYPDGYKDTLGWALQPEFGYSPSYQCEARYAYGNKTCLIEHPDGNVVVLVNSGITFWYWYFLSATSN